MSTQGTPKPSTKVQRTAKEMPVNNILDARVSRQPTSTVPKANSPQLKDNGSVPVLSRTNSIRRDTRVSRQRTSTVPKANSPQLKDNGSVPVLSRTNSIRRDTRVSRQPTSTVPKANSPQLKDNGSVPVLSRTNSIRRSSRKWRPKPAHSGVPVPDEMKKLIEKEIQDSKFQV